MAKRISAGLAGVAVLVALWVLVRIPAYLEQRKNCTSRLLVETCSQAYAKCVELRHGTPEHCEEVRRGCEQCVGKAWKALFFQGQGDWPR
jgi:hypothetical protein